MLIGYAAENVVEVFQVESCEVAVAIEGVEI